MIKQYSLSSLIQHHLPSKRIGFLWWLSSRRYTLSTHTSVNVNIAVMLPFLCVVVDYKLTSVWTVHKSAKTQNNEKTTNAEMAMTACCLTRNKISEGLTSATGINFCFTHTNILFALKVHKYGNYLLMANWKLTKYIAEREIAAIKQMAKFQINWPANATREISWHLPPSLHTQSVTCQPRIKRDRRN